MAVVVSTALIVGRPESVTSTSTYSSVTVGLPPSESCLLSMSLRSMQAANPAKEFISNTAPSYSSCAKSDFAVSSWMDAGTRSVSKDSGSAYWQNLLS